MGKTILAHTARKVSASEYFWLLRCKFVLHLFSFWTRAAIYSYFLPSLVLSCMCFISPVCFYLCLDLYPLLSMCLFLFLFQLSASSRACLTYQHSNRDQHQQHACPCSAFCPAPSLTSSHSAHSHRLLIYSNQFGVHLSYCSQQQQQLSPEHAYTAQSLIRL